MELTLTIKADAATMAAILAALPQASNAPSAPYAEMPSAPVQPPFQMPAPAPSLEMPSAPVQPPFQMPTDAPPPLELPAPAPSFHVPTDAPPPFQMPAPAQQQDEPGDTVPMTQGQVDVHGIRHDPRIHSETPTLTAKNEWRKRRGVSEDLIAKVEAEQRAQRVLTPAPVPPPFQMPVPPVLPPLQMPVAPVQTAPMDFSTFMTELAQRMGRVDPQTGERLITPDYIAGLTQRVARHFNQPLKAITDVVSQNNPQMVTYMVQLLTQDGKWL